MTKKTSATLIKFAAWGFIAFAFVWGLAPYTAINAPSRVLLDVLDWPFGDGAPSLTRSEMWLSSIGAGLVLGVSIMLLGIVAPAIRNGQKQVGRVTAWAFVGWYVMDGLGSAVAGVPSNVFFNTILLIMILVPLLMVRYEE